MDDKSSNSGASSSDFVRKLYKMLEDPTYDSVVRWGNEGDSFVVLENEKFTKHILPKHFKHSNFASFVRQLNKYDFHKVRHNNEENNIQTQYGAGAWEFKHPDFKANNKDALDNIRRKAPVPRKANQAIDEPGPTPQMDLFNGQLMATQQQLQTIQDRYHELSLHHATLLQEVIGLQKTVVNHEHVIQNVMSYLHSVDSQRRRQSKELNNPFAQGGTNGTSSADQMASMDDDEVATPLAHADKLMNELSAEVILNSKTLEQMTEVTHRMNGAISTPPPSEAAFRAGIRPTSRQGPPSASSTTTMRYGDLENVVYPVGQTQGIDPRYSEHIHNIPYPMPTKTPQAPDPTFTQPSVPEPRKKTTMDPGWIRQPHILLVEDDPTCRRIGGKFLYAFNCAIDYALDGLEAVNKMNTGSKYDLVLMDIIMPNLDGVSACHLIRQFDSTPIIAMTSNIRSDDISMYFQHGMNDVLPKPFTKEGLLSMLEKHLSHLKKPTPGMESTNPAGHMGAAALSSRQSLKDEGTPSASPATVSTNWNSPIQPSPVTTGMTQDEYMHAVRQPIGYGTLENGIGQAGGSYTTQNPMAGGPQNMRHRRNISDISGGEDVKPDMKRQLYAPVPAMQGGRY